jgi:hypothetical protein
MFCPSCGKAIADGSAFCMHCGKATLAAGMAQPPAFPVDQLIRGHGD